jgi:hypothetical protein
MKRMTGRREALTTRRKLSSARFIMTVAIRPLPDRPPLMGHGALWAKLQGYHLQTRLRHPAKDCTPLQEETRKT